MAFNRLLRFHVVRSTRPCVFIPACFIGQKAYRNPRDPSHMERNPKYPDPHYFLNYTQKYMFRHESLRHLRVEQFNRYLSPSESENAKSAQTAEDTIEDVPEDAPPTDVHHRNFDEFMESTPAGMGTTRSWLQAKDELATRRVSCPDDRTNWSEPGDVLRS